MKFSAAGAWLVMRPCGVKRVMDLWKELETCLVAYVTSFPLSKDLQETGTLKDHDPCYIGTIGSPFHAQVFIHSQVIQITYQKKHSSHFSFSFICFTQIFFQAHKQQSSKPNLRKQALGCTRIVTSQMNRRQTQIPRDNSVKTNAAASMGRNCIRKSQVSMKFK